MRIFLIAPILIIATITSYTAAANERITLRGFGTVGYTTMVNRTAGEAYDPESMSYYRAETDSYWGINRRARFGRDTRFGLNIDAEITPNLYLSAQLYGEGAVQTTGMSQYFNSQFTLLTLRSEILSNWTVIVGRFPTPLWMISEERYIGFTYPYIRLPSEVVAITRTGETMEGFSTYYNFYLGNWVIRPRVTFGSYDHMLPYAQNAMLGTDANILFNNIQFEYDNMLFTVGYHTFHGVASQIITQKVHQPPVDIGINLLNQIDFKGYNIAFGMKAELPWVVLLAEYNANNSTVYNQQGFMRGLADSTLESSGSYALVGIPLGRWLPRVTYARIWQAQRLPASAVETFADIFVTQNPQVEDELKAAARQALRVRGDRVVRDLYQTDVHQRTLNIGLNYQLSFTTILKMELERAHAPNNGSSTSGLLDLKRGSTVDTINMAIEFVL